jgi:hypothetical protein
MKENAYLAPMLEDLLDVLRLQAQEIEDLIDHVEQTAARLGYESRMPQIVSRLSELRQRMRRRCESSLCGGAGEQPRPAARCLSSGQLRPEGAHATTGPAPSTAY